MASTLTTRVAAGSALIIGCVAMTIIIWRKLNKGKKSSGPDKDKKSKTPSINTNKDAFEKQDEEESEKDLQTAVREESCRDTGQDVGGASSMTPVPTPKGDMSSSGESGENYTCENGVCRLIKPSTETWTKNSVDKPDRNVKETTKSSTASLEESITKSLNEYFKEDGGQRMDEDHNGSEETMGEVIVKEHNMNLRNQEGSSQHSPREIISSQPVTEEVADSIRIEQISSATACQPTYSENSHNVHEVKIKDNTSPHTEANNCDSIEQDIQTHGTISVSRNQTVSSASEETVPATSVSDQAVDDQRTISRDTVSVEEGSSGGHNLGLAEACKEFIPEEEVKKFSHQEMADAILVSQNSPGLLSSGNAEVLVSLLSHPDDQMQMSALNGIKKSSSFTRNQNLFREHGCIPKLSRLLRSQIMSLQRGAKSSENVVTSVNNTITNLATNEENHRNMEECVPTLVDLALEDETGEAVCLSSLQALTNLSLTDQYHGHYTRLVQRLYDFLDTDQDTIKLQSLKVLVNLSCNAELVPHILAAKAPACLMAVLKQGSDEALLLRMTTFLANILQTVKKENISVLSLPTDDKAPSPETMYSALYGMNNIGHIKSKVFLLCRHRNMDIRTQASRIYQSIAK